MRGFKIFYRDGTDQVINSIEGTNKGTVNFEATDVLVGMTVIFTSEGDKRPRKIGFTINRNGSIIQTEPKGNDVGFHAIPWPSLESIGERQDVD